MYCSICLTASTGRPTPYEPDHTNQAQHQHQNEWNAAQMSEHHKAAPTSDDECGVQLQPISPERRVLKELPEALQVALPTHVWQVGHHVAHDLWGGHCVVPNTVIVNIMQQHVARCSVHDCTYMFVVVIQHGSLVAACVSKQCAGCCAAKVMNTDCHKD